MIGLILVGISWALLRAEGRGLAVLGFDQPRRRLREFALGFVVLGAFAAVQQLGYSLSTGDAFVVNPKLEVSAWLDGLRFTVNSVLYEELLFRGYLLYQAIRWLGATRAVLLDAAAFGVYHWFSYGVIGDPVTMAFVFVLTGMYGLMWAQAFAATGSVAAPIGLHFGWNAVSYLGFSAGPLVGAGLLAPASGVAQLQADGWPWLALSVGLPLLATLVVLRYFIMRE